MAMLHFQQPFLQSSLSHDPSEIILICWFAAEESFVLTIFNAEKSCAAYIFVETMQMFFRILWMEKGKHLFFHQKLGRWSCGQCSSYSAVALCVSQVRILARGPFPILPPVSPTSFPVNSKLKIRQKKKLGKWKHLHR